MYNRNFSRAFKCWYSKAHETLCYLEWGVLYTKYTTQYTYKVYNTYVQIRIQYISLCTLTCIYNIVICEQEMNERAFDGTKSVGDLLEWVLVCILM